MYFGKDVKIRGYFSKPQGVRKQKSLGNAVINPQVWNINDVKRYISGQDLCATN
jgi:hypothetical protein